MQSTFKYSLSNSTKNDRNNSRKCSRRTLLILITDFLIICNVYFRISNVREFKSWWQFHHLKLKLRAKEKQLKQKSKVTNYKTVKSVAKKNFSNTKTGSGSLILPYQMRHSFENDATDLRIITGLFAKSTIKSIIKWK